ncbi:putative glucosylceramidase 3 [Atheta coriaria]|uniref:putative glucosylceramidase 3 n=1 Tax=Dalotia coriaria TaxID=877792 RepID=UPI0031F398A6
MGRIPMGATDFSRGPYSYAEIVDDNKLEHFALKEEDYKLKIPVLRKALELNPQLNIIASPWTCPFWMKSNDNYAFMGVLKHKYYQTYADYYIKFLEKYSEAGVNVWGITTGNEPWNGFWPFPLPILGWFMADVARWVRKNLGPTIRSSKQFNATKIIIHDDQKIFYHVFFRDDQALSYVDGVGVHWYLNKITPKAFLNFAKTPKKDLFIIGTEATNGFLQFPSVELGSWSRAERYADDIFDDLEYGAAGWIDWNIALDMYGGPVYTHFHADSTIIINSDADEFYKQPTYYIMGHFSKFLSRGSLRISVETALHNKRIRVLAYKRPDNGIVLIIYNKSEDNVNLNIKDLLNGCATVKIRAKSISSLVYW